MHIRFDVVLPTYKCQRKHLLSLQNTKSTKRWRKLYLGTVGAPPPSIQQICIEGLLCIRHCQAPRAGQIVLRGTQSSKKVAKELLFIEFPPPERCPLLTTLLDGKYYFPHFIDTEEEAQICPRSPRSVCSFCFPSLPTLYNLFLYLSLEEFQTLFI